MESEQCYQVCIYSVSSVSKCVAGMWTVLPNVSMEYEQRYQMCLWTQIYVV